MAIKQRLELDVRQYQQNLNKAKRSLRDFARDAGRDAGRGMERGAREAERAWDRAGGRISGILEGIKRLILTVFAARLITDFTKSIVQATDKLGGFRLSFEELTGSAEKASGLLKEIREFSRSSPLSFETAATSARQLLAFGLAAEEVLPNLRALTDMAAAVRPDQMEETIRSAAIAIGQMRGATRLSKEEMNQLRDAGVDAMGLLQKATGKSRQELDAMLEKGAEARDVVKALFAAMSAEYSGAARRMAGNFTSLVTQLRSRLWEAMAEFGSRALPLVASDLRKLIGEFDRLSQSGNLSGTLARAASAANRLYLVLKQMLGILWDMRSPLIFLGAAHLAFKAMSGPMQGIVRLGQNLAAEFRKAKDEILQTMVALQRVSSVTDASASLNHISAAEARSISWRHLPPAFGLGQEVTDNLGKVHRLTQASADEMNRFYWASRAAGRTHQQVMAAAPAQMARVASSTKAAAGATTIFGRAVRSVGVALKTTFSIASILTGALSAMVGIVVALGVEWLMFGDRVKGATKKLKEHRKALEETRDLLANADDRLKGMELFKARKVMLELEIKDFTNDPDLKKLPKKLRDLVVEGLKAGNEDVVRQILSAYELSSPMSNTGPGGGRAQITGIQRLQSLGLTRRDVAANRDALRTLADRLKLLQEYYGVVRELSEEERGNYAIRLGALEAEEQALSVIVKKTQEQEARLAFVRQQIEHIRKLMNPPQTGNAPDDYGNMEIDLVSPTTSAADEITPMSEEELMHRLNLIRAHEELKSQYRELQGLQEQLVRLDEEHAALAEDDPRRALYRDLIDLTAREIEAKSAAYDRAVQMMGLYEKLGPDVKAFVDEMGGLQELFEQGLTTEDVDTFLPIVSKLEAWSETLTTELGKIQRDLDLEIISEEDARAQAARVAETFRRQLVKMLQDVNVDALPAPFRGMVQELVSGLAGDVAGAMGETAGEARRARVNIEALVRSGRTLLRLADMFGDLSDGVRNFAEGLLDALDNVSQLAGAWNELSDAQKKEAGGFMGFATQLSNLPSTIGVVAGVAAGIYGLVDGINARRKEAREQAERHRRELRRIQDSLRSYQQSLRQSIERLFTGGRAGADLRRSQIAEAKDAAGALAGFLESIGGRGGRTGRGYTPPQYTDREKDRARELVADLNDLGVFDTDLVGLFDTLMEQYDGNLQQVLGYILSGIRGRSGDGEWEGVNAVLERLEEELGDFTGDLEGAVDAVSFFARFMGEDAVAQFKRFTDLLLDTDSELFEKLDEDLVAELTKARGLDLSTQEGRDQLAAIIARIAGNFSEYMGDLTNEELERLLAELQRILDDAGRQGEGEDEFTRNVQWLRTITEAQAHEMVVLLTEISYYLRRLYQHFTNGAIYVPSVPQASAGRTSPGTATYVARFGDVHITANWDRLAQTAGRELERTVQRKKLRAF